MDCYKKNSLPSGEFIRIEMIFLRNFGRNDNEKNWSVSLSFSIRKNESLKLNSKGPRSHSNAAVDIRMSPIIEKKLSIDVTKWKLSTEKYFGEIIIIYAWSKLMKILILTLLTTHA